MRPRKHCFFFSKICFHLASNISPHVHGPALFLCHASYARTGFLRPQSAQAFVHTSRRTTLYFDEECRVSRLYEGIPFGWALTAMPLRYSSSRVCGVGFGVGSGASVT